MGFWPPEGVGVWTRLWFLDFMNSGVLAIMFEFGVGLLRVWVVTWIFFGVLLRCVVFV